MLLKSTPCAGQLFHTVTKTPEKTTLRRKETIGSQFNSMFLGCMLCLSQKGMTLGKPHNYGSQQKETETDKKNLKQSSKTIPVTYFFQLSPSSLSHLPTMPSNHPMSLSIGCSTDEVRAPTIQSLHKSPSSEVGTSLQPMRTQFLSKPQHTPGARNSTGSQQTLRVKLVPSLEGNYS